jgi:hypothetical protein
MKTWNVKTEQGLVQITARNAYADAFAKDVVWADGVRTAFPFPVYYVTDEPPLKEAEL